MLKVALEPKINKYQLSLVRFSDLSIKNGVKNLLKSIAIIIRRCYCREVRENKSPLSLVGNNGLNLVIKY